MKLLLIKNGEYVVQIVQTLHKLVFKWVKRYINTIIKRAIQLMASSNPSSLNNKHIKTQFYDLLCAALKDAISNVRFTSCSVVQTCVQKIKLDQDIKNQFKDVLNKIAKSDQDED
eukprot:114377_1